MQKWEYDVVPVKDLGEAMLVLAQQGENGWELVAVTKNEVTKALTLYLKRPMLEA